jgi:hypothetical protein
MQGAGRTQPRSQRSRSRVRDSSGKPTGSGAQRNGRGLAAYSPTPPGGTPKTLFFILFLHTNCISYKDGLWPLAFGGWGGVLHIYNMYRKPPLHMCYMWRRLLVIHIYNMYGGCRLYLIQGGLWARTVFHIRRPVAEAAVSSPFSHLMMRAG